MSLVNMETSAEEAREYTQPTEGDAPKYPYGLTINIDEEGLKKLGITSMPAVGTQMTLTALVEVCSTSQYQDRSGETESSLSLQITDMELNGSGLSNEEAAQRLFGAAASSGLLD